MKTDKLLVLVTFTLLLLATSCGDQSTHHATIGCIERKLYFTGVSPKTIFMEGNQCNGLWDGLWTVYGIYGEQRATVHFRNGTLLGRATLFDRLGYMEAILNFGDDLKLDGEFIEFDRFKGGNPLTIGQFSNGRPAGLWKWYSTLSDELEFSRTYNLSKDIPDTNGSRGAITYYKAHDPVSCAALYLDHLRMVMLSLPAK